jgi:hypothetical protein
MSVKILYCEGNAQSIDIRVISQIVPQGCLVKAIGGKTYGFAEKVLSDRIINPRLAGLGDRDFLFFKDNQLCVDFIPDETPFDWFDNGQWVGWLWERKEIENYLLDPIIIEYSLRKKKRTNC